MFFLWMERGGPVSITCLLLASMWKAEGEQKCSYRNCRRIFVFSSSHRYIKRQAKDAKAVKKGLVISSLLLSVSSPMNACE